MQLTVLKPVCNIKQYDVILKQVSNLGEHNHYLKRCPDFSTELLEYCQKCITNYTATILLVSLYLRGY